MSVPHQFSLINTNDDWAWPGNETFHYSSWAHAEGDRFFFSFLFYQLQQPQSRNMIPDHFMKPHEMKLDEMWWDLATLCSSNILYDLIFNCFGLIKLKWEHIACILQSSLAL